MAFIRRVLALLHDVEERARLPARFASGERSSTAREVGFGGEAEGSGKVHGGEDGEGALRGTQRSGMYVRAFAGWDAGGRELPHRRLVSEEGLVSRGRYGGLGTAATRNATQTTHKNTVERFLKRLRSHSNSKLDPRNDTRKLKKTGTPPYELTPHAHAHRSRPNARHKMMSTVRCQSQREDHDALQGRSGK